ncbi:MAG: hypothetical protein E7130_04775 [Rikenellaceae bacterium]|nr:hypothetical protein [Rikenellaceae bacterium]
METTAYCHDIYHGGGACKIQGNIEYDIVALKGDSNYYRTNLNDAKTRIYNILLEDLNQIVDKYPEKQFTVCAIPRAKRDCYYNNLLHFRDTIKNAVREIENLHEGVNYIQRTIDTRTTHFKDSNMFGHLPYPGITLDTCKVSNEVRGKDILLIDDVYTSSVNIDEDAIQALLNKGAKSVIFYSIGHTGVIDNNRTSKEYRYSTDLTVEVRIIGRSKPDFIKDKSNIEGATQLNCQDNVDNSSNPALYTLIITPEEAVKIGLNDLVFDKQIPLGTVSLINTSELDKAPIYSFVLENACKEDYRIYAKIKSAKLINKHIDLIDEAKDIFLTMHGVQFNPNTPKHVEFLLEITKTLKDLKE